MAANPILLRRLHSSAFINGVIKGEVLDFQEFLDCVCVRDAIYDLVSEALLKAIIIAEVAVLG